MAAIRNPYPHSLFCVRLGRVVEAEEIVDGLSDEDAAAICATGIFERGVVVATSASEPVADPETPGEDAEPATDEPGDDEQSADAEEPQRPAGRRGGRRGAAAVEETSAPEDERETR